jgi:hypothetical protein
MKQLNKILTLARDAKLEVVGFGPKLNRDFYILKSL